MIVFILTTILAIIFCVIYYNKFKLIEKERKEELEHKQKFFNQWYDSEKQKIIERINNELKDLNNQIEEKKNFNNSLLRIREEELNRLIETSKKEKTLALENELAILKQKKILDIDTQASVYQTQKNLEIDKMVKEVEQLQIVLNDYKQKRDSINDAILREREIQEKEAFYKIDISKSNQDDISILEQIRPKLSNREALSKLIWEVFIQRPTVEMIKRVTGGRDISGIYKITYIKTGESYIGKTTNIKTRWQNHIRTVIGLEGAAHSTLHTHMEKNGLWIYTFEILEEVSKDKLTEREKFYINLYNTTKQLNMREG